MHPKYSQIIDTEVICTSEVMVSPAGTFLPLAPVRQQHHKQLCQLQGSEHPHNPPAGIAVKYSMKSTFIELYIYRALRFCLNVAYTATT